MLRAPDIKAVGGSFDCCFRSTESMFADAVFRLFQKQITFYKMLYCCFR